MGGVRYAVDDSLADPWANPALGTLLERSTFHGSPTFYTIEDQGGGRAFPVSATLTDSTWFGGASIALQQIENRPIQGFFAPFALPDPSICCFGPGEALSDRYGRNLYIAGFTGLRLGNGWSVGAGISAADLDAMDGVDLLYAGADRIEQSGSIVDVRLGAVREGDGERVEVVVAHDRVSMSHDVTYSDWIWPDSLGGPIRESRLEQNEDRTRTWAGSATWTRDLDTPGWRLGSSLTVNRKSHPKIPNYSLQNIPRDPGTTWAYELGFGFARSVEGTTFALDVAVQPIWSDTWQVANADDAAASAGRVDVGDHSIDNEFFFTNVLLRTGLSHHVGAIGLQAGMEVRSYDYGLEQVNRVEATVRDQKESWIEWSPTFGADVDFDALSLRYGLRVTTGTGRPGSLGGRGGPVPGLETLSAGDSDFLLAPDGALTLVDARVVSHQFSIHLPIH